MGTRHFNVIDDTFTLDKNRVRKIADIFYNLNCTWNCWAHVGTIMDKELLRYMKDKGCKGLLLGIESGSDRILKLINKGITIEKIRECFRLINEIGFKNVEANFIVGSHPSENLDDLMLTKGLIKEIRPTILAVSVITPYPGTEVFNIMKKEGLIKSFDWDHYVTYGKEPKWRTFHFSGRKLIRLQQWLMLNFFFSPRNIINRLKLIEGYRELFYYIKGGISFLKDIFYTKIEALIWRNSNV